MIRYHKETVWFILKLRRGPVSFSHSIRLDPSNARIVRLLVENPGLVRGQLARALGLNLASVAPLVRALLEVGVLVEEGHENSRGGRPATRLKVSKNLAVALAHAVIGDHLHSASINLDGEVLAQTSSTFCEDTLAPSIRAHEVTLASTLEGALFAGYGAVTAGIPSRAQGVLRWSKHGDQILNFSTSSSQRLMITSPLSGALWRFAVAKTPSLRKSRTLCLSLIDTPTSSITSENHSIHFYPHLCSELGELPLQLPPWHENDNEKRFLEEVVEEHPEALEKLDQWSFDLSKFICSLINSFCPQKVLIEAPWANFDDLIMEHLGKNVKRRCRVWIKKDLDLEWLHHSTENTLAGAGLLAIDEMLRKMESPI
jgi:hypothetical protein